MFMAAVIERFGWPVCAVEQPGLHGADTGGAWRCGMVVV
jgi:hypothetical protein